MIQGPRAVFEPFPPNLDIDKEIQTTNQFQHAARISCEFIDQFPREDLELYILTWVVKLGRPLVITGFDKRIDKNLFSEKWLMHHYANQSTSPPHPWMKVLFENCP